MATSKSAGATRLGRDSRPKYLGLKVANGETVKAGQILVRQRGTNFVMGINVGMGKDYTLFAQKPGIVQFAKRKKVNFDRSTHTVSALSVLESQPQ
jgi:large subunit ribosomal protein L27